MSTQQLCKIGLISTAGDVFGRRQTDESVGFRSLHCRQLLVTQGNTIKKTLHFTPISLFPVFLKRKVTPTNRVGERMAERYSLTEFLDKRYELLILAQRKDGALERRDNSREAEELRTG